MDAPSPTRVSGHARDRPEAGCDYGKHGSHLDRPSVQVQWTGLEETYGFHVSFAEVPASDYVKTVRVGIIMKDGKEMKLEVVLASVLDYWERKFVAEAL